MKRNRIKILMGILLVISAAFLFAGNYFYDQGIKRGTEIELHSESTAVNAEASEQDQQIVIESKEWFDQQELEDLTITAFDGLQLQASFYRNPEPSGKAAILAHGFRQQGTDMGKYTKLYADRGFDILLPDARGHGESEGDYIGFGWHDRLDYIKWIQLLIEQYDEKQLVLHGHSMGAATVLATSGEELPQEVKAIVADSSYSTTKDELAHQLKHIYSLPSFPLLEVTSAVTKVRAGWTFEEADMLAQVKKNQLPLFIIHGDADDLVPTRMAKEIYDAAQSEKNLWLVPGAGHTKAFDNQSSEFETRLFSFLESSLSE